METWTRPLAQVEDLHQTMPFDPLCVKQLVHVFDTYNLS